MNQQSPFVTGTRVAISNGWDNWHEGEIEKVYKTGRFTLKGCTKQWRPSSPLGESGYWRAHPTGGDNWSRTYLRIWDERADAEIKEIFAAQARKNRRRKLHDLLGAIHDGNLTDAMLDQIEAAVSTASRTGGEGEP